MLIRASLLTYSPWLTADDAIQAQVDVLWLADALSIPADSTLLMDEAVLSLLSAGRLAAGGLYAVRRQRECFITTQRLISKDKWCCKGYRCSRYEWNRSMLLLCLFILIANA